MYCDWGSGWHGFPYYHGGLAALVVLIGVVALAAFLFCYTRRKARPQSHCPACGGRVEEVFLRCPFCGTTLRRHCNGCNRIIKADYRFCPFCRTPTGVADQEAAEDAGTATTPRNQQENVVR
ncbi:double zinc ribbon domain-containing protein [Thermodesulfobacteriota bacterium B35]